MAVTFPALLCRLCLLEAWDDFRSPCPFYEHDLLACLVLCLLSVGCLQSGS